MAQWTVRLPALLALVATQMGFLASQVGPASCAISLYASCLLTAYLQEAPCLCCEKEKVAWGARSVRPVRAVLLHHNQTMHQNHCQQG